ncbi:MAG: CDP-archaeol synthase [Bacteroidetes bacterium]|nr:CDP-archaeol synthase [Bacteroidota bacterium]
MNNFTARTITGLSLAFTVIICLILSRWALAGAFLVVVVLGLNEFYNLVTTEQVKPQKYFGIIAGAIWFSSYAIISITPNSFLNFFHSGAGFLMLFLPVILLFLVPVFEIFRKQSNPVMNVAYTWFGLLYIPFSIACLIVPVNKISPEFHGIPAFLLGYFILVWFYDTSAYLYGSRFGKHKFFERVSPKKTWEGIIAGIAVAILTAIGLSYLITEISLTDWFILTGIIIIFGTAGDLFESLIKRSLNIKDSGSILPGHGGILDRFDSVFLSAPFVFIFYIVRLSFS